MKTADQKENDEDGEIDKPGSPQMDTSKDEAGEIPKSPTECKLATRQFEKTFNHLFKRHDNSTSAENIAMAKTCIK